jgi:hypothetical protein
VPGAWRPTVGAALPRTLGVTNDVSAARDNPHRPGPQLESGAEWVLRGGVYV